MIFGKKQQQKTKKKQQFFTKISFLRLKCSPLHCENETEIRFLNTHSGLLKTAFLKCVLITQCNFPLRKCSVL